MSHRVLLTDILPETLWINVLFCPPMGVLEIGPGKLLIYGYTRIRSKYSSVPMT